MKNNMFSPFDSLLKKVLIILLLVALASPLLLISVAAFEFKASCGEWANFLKAIVIPFEYERYTTQPEPDSFIEPVEEIEDPRFYGTTAGRFAKPFRLRSVRGGRVELEEYIGNPVILTFWTTWHSECGGQLSCFQHTYNERWSELEVIAVAVREEVSVVKQVQGIRNYSFEVLIDKDGAVAKDYNVTSIPTTFFIDSDGRIFHVKEKHYDSVKQIEEVLEDLD